MPLNDNAFPHLAFEVVLSGRARLMGGGNPGQRERENREVARRLSHADRLRGAATNLASQWRASDEQRHALNLPSLPPGRPLVIITEEDTDVDFLRSAFGFEIIAEQDGGYVLASTEDPSFARLNEAIELFLRNVHGGGSTAKLYELLDAESTQQRLNRVLSATLLERWATIQDDTALILDISVACTGGMELPPAPVRLERETDEHLSDRQAAHEQRSREAQQDGRRLPRPPTRREQETEEHFVRRQADHVQRCRDIQVRWDEVQRQRVTDLEQAIRQAGGAILSITQEADGAVFHLADSFTIRARVPGKYFRDVAQNHPYVFQIVEPEEVESPDAEGQAIPNAPAPEIAAPLNEAPAVCVIDSGIQEGHFYLRPAIVSAESRCFIPGAAPADTADYVSPHGHGTRVAGAVLYPRNLPTAGERVDLPFWIHNARVLDRDNKVPEELMPALYLERVIRHFSDPARLHPARLFNHSINSRATGRHVHMSTWATAIDKLSYERDVLVIQSAGNISAHAVTAHLQAGRAYPQYQMEQSCRIRNPGQSLSALTVGSIAHVFWQNGQRESVAHQDHPSAFSPAGAGIWGSVKPDVVEYGGDFVADSGPPVRAFAAGEVACEMVRSTLHGLGATSKDDVGTSFSAPKVCHVAATLARALPDQPCLLYRALIANSARWPTWADTEEDKLSVLRRIGYGVPDVGRATTNSEFRVTLISSGAQEIPAREAHVYHIPIPDELRSAEHDYLIRLDVTLSYAAAPRQTRRHVKGYLATWLDWDVSKAGETMESFRNRIFRDGNDGIQDGGPIFNWMLRDRIDHGQVQGMSRQNSTLQKDWCFVRSHDLPPDFCVAVVGHEGWDPSPAGKAKYALAVSFEAVNEDLRVYAPIRVAVEAQVPVEVRERVTIDAGVDAG